MARLTTVEAAQIAGVTDKTIREWIGAGHLKARRVGNGNHSIRISRTALDRALRNPLPKGRPRNKGKGGR